MTRLAAVCSLLALLPRADLTLQAQTPAPSCTAAQHRQFDFWIGDWNVYGPRGKLAGRNTITRVYGGCVIREHYVGARGYTGGSFNIYDASRDRWHQTWVDNSGGLHQYWGSLENGNMVFHGEVPMGAASKVAGRRWVRLTFFPMGPDKVRQFSETLNMDGTWSTGYDLIYTRRKPAS